MEERIKRRSEKKTGKGVNFPIQEVRGRRQRVTPGVKQKIEQKVEQKVELR